MATELSYEEKVELWHNGSRKINLKSCKEFKLSIYHSICFNRGYHKEANDIFKELMTRYSDFLDVDTLNLMTLSNKKREKIFIKKLEALIAKNGQLSPDKDYYIKIKDTGLKLIKSILINMLIQKNEWRIIKEFCNLDLGAYTPNIQYYTKSNGQRGVVFGLPNSYRAKFTYLPVYIQLACIQSDWGNIKEVNVDFLEKEYFDRNYNLTFEEYKKRVNSY